MRTCRKNCACSVDIVIRNGGLIAEWLTVANHLDYYSIRLDEGRRNGPYAVPGSPDGRNFTCGIHCTGRFVRARLMQHAGLPEDRAEGQVQGKVQLS